MYFSQQGGGRRIGSTVTIGSWDFLAGVVIEQVEYKQVVQKFYGPEIEKDRLALAKVVHASLIKEAIELLPDPSTE